jgi:hypothetical protein
MGGEMKSYTKPTNPLQQGRCFICLKQLDNPLAYAHHECCLSASNVKELANAQAKINDLKVLIEEKDKLLYPKPSKK